jgi:hypothetical protein
MPETRRPGAWQVLLNRTRVRAVVPGRFRLSPPSKSSRGSIKYPRLAGRKTHFSGLILYQRSAASIQGVAGSGVDRVQVYLGAERDNGGRFLGEANLGFSDSIPDGLYGAQFTSAGWRLVFKPTQFRANTYLLFAYARSAVSGREDVAVRFFAIKESQ